MKLFGTIIIYPCLFGVELLFKELEEGGGYYIVCITV